MKKKIIIIVQDMEDIRPWWKKSFAVIPKKLVTLIQDVHLFEDVLENRRNTRRLSK